MSDQDKGDHINLEPKSETKTNTGQSSSNATIMSRYQPVLDARDFMVPGFDYSKAGMTLNEALRRVANLPPDEEYDD